jgi:hypothetical protein
MRGSAPLFIEEVLNFPQNKILFFKLKSSILAYGGAKGRLQQLINKK